ncbi:MAG: hypothetical protein ACR2JR_00505 [Rubrobacteraceae bacterium]
MRGLISFLIRWTGLLCVPGGILWALSPLGIHLSELKFKTPDVFWKLFPSAPLLLLVGLIGLQLRQSGRSSWLQKAGFFAAAAGLVLIVLGDVGLYWLRLDNVYIMTAPAWRSFRLGLILLALGSILFGAFAPKDGALPTWGLLPFVVGGLCGLVAFLHDFGTPGAVLWALFGAGWAWLGLSLLVHGLLSFWRKKRTSARSSPPDPKPL